MFLRPTLYMNAGALHVPYKIQATEKMYKQQEDQYYDILWHLGFILTCCKN